MTRSLRNPSIVRKRTAPLRLRLLYVLLALSVQAPGAQALRGEVTLVGEVAKSGEIRRLLAEWNTALEIHLAAQLDAAEILRREPQVTQLRIWVTLSSAELATIYFKDPSGERYLVREVPLATGLDEAGRETLAQVIATSADAFVDRQADSSVSEVEFSLRGSTTNAAQAEHTVAPLTGRGQLTVSGTVRPSVLQLPAANRARWRPHLGGFYAVTLIGASEVGQGPGGSLGAARITEASRWLLAVAVQYRLPLSVQAQAIDLEVRTTTVYGMIALDRTLSKRWFFGVELGLGFEVTRVNAIAHSDSGVAVRPDVVHYRPVAVPSLRAGANLGAIHVTASVGILTTPLLTHYDVVDRIYTPWLLEPRSAIELCW